MLAAGMLAITGRIQREGEVVHLIGRRISDMSGELAAICEKDTVFPLPHGRGDELRRGSPGIDSRDRTPLGMRARDLYEPDRRIEALRI